MHLFIFFRGVNHYLDLYKSLIESQFWTWKRKDLKTGKDATTMVQGALRPSFFGCYEYIFPEEALPEVIAIFGLQKNNANYEFRFNVIRKMFGLKKIPKEAWEKAKKINPNVFITGMQRCLAKVEVASCGMNVIGIKYDKKGEMYGYYQEGL